MGNMPKISVIMPAYNCAGLVPDTLVSIKNQTLKEIEIIVINDGSTDNTLEVLQEWAAHDSRFIIETVTNGGPAKARNIGIAKARGEYLYFIDSDDLIHCDMLFEMYTLAKENSLEVCACGYVMENISTKEAHCKDFLFHDFATENQAEYREQLMPMIKAHLMYVVWNKLFKAQFLNDNNIRFSDYFSGEDRLFNTATFEYIKSFGFISKPFYRYFLRGQETLANRYVANRFASSVKCHEELMAVYKRMNLYNEKNEAYISFMFIKGVTSCISQLNAKACKLKYSEKMTEISKMLKHPLVKEALSKKADGFSYATLVNAVYKLGNESLIYLMGKAIFIMQFKLNTIYLNIKHHVK